VNQLDKMKDKLEVLDLLEEIEDMLENVSSVPLTGKIMLNRNELIDIISKISTKIPEEYQHVKYLFKNREEILLESEKEAQLIIQKAKEKEAKIMKQLEQKKKELNIEFTKEHQKLVDDHEIVVAAREKAAGILEDAKRKSLEMRNSSFDYSKEMLVKSKRDLESRAATLERNIAELDNMK